MLRYNDVRVTFQEIPNEVSLTFSITGCPYRCEGCHSPELRESFGECLTGEKMVDYINKNPFITCVTFLGGDNDFHWFTYLASIIRKNNKKVALYTGSDEIDVDFYNVVDYLKIGHYDKHRGPLTSKTTNQCLINTKTGEDITYLFWKEQTYDTK
jgi:anaerobic ribonucleoside-triphosphate reductase activating protein